MATPGEDSGGGAGAQARAGASGLGAPKGLGDVRHDGHGVSQATVLRLLRDEGLTCPPSTSANAASSPQRRKAAFAVEPSGPNQVWQLDFSEFETTTRRDLAARRLPGLLGKYEHGFHVSPTANQHDAIAAVELAMADYEQLFGHPMVDTAPSTLTPASLLPVVTIVTDNGGPFRSFRFEAFIASRTRAASRPHPRQNPGPERVTRTRLRHAEVRAAVPRRDRRRRRCSSNTPRTTGSSTTPSDPTKPSPGTGRTTSTWAGRAPSSPPFPNDRKPANYLTRDIDLRPDLNGWVE